MRELVKISEAHLDPDAPPPEPEPMTPEQSVEWLREQRAAVS